MTYDIIQDFKDADALLEGHFILSSGLHSPTFLQKNLVMMDPVRAERACKALAEKITAEFGEVDVVVSPAVGGIIPGYETARHLGCRSIYVERVDSVFALRRGFTFNKNERVVMVEDIITTGLSSRECLDAIKSFDIHILGGACLIDRSGGKADIGFPYLSLAVLDIPTYAPDQLPPELARIPAVKPGSRAL
ncbi:MAG: orotate phosphoribosyltransferase [Pseudomonadota bacterium]